MKLQEITFILNCITVIILLILILRLAKFNSK